MFILFLITAQSHSFYITGNWREIESNGKVIYGATERGIMVVDPETGEMLKDFPTEGILLSISSYKDKLVGYDSLMGLYIFKMDKKDPLIPLVHCSRVPHGTYRVNIYRDLITLYGKDSLHFFSLRENNIELLKSVKIIKPNSLTLDHGKVAYSRDTHLYLFSLPALDTLWVKELPHRIISSVITPQYLLVSDAEKTLYLLDAETGEILDTTKTIESVKSFSFLDKYIILYKTSSISFLKIKSKKMHILSTVRLHGTTYDAVSMGRRVFFSAGDKIKVVNVKKIKEPVEEKPIRTEFSVEGVVANGSIAFTALGKKGISIFKVMGDSLKEYSLIESNGANYINLYVNGNLLFALAGRDGIYVYDVGRLKRPKHKNYNKPGGRVTSIVRVKDKYLAACGKQGVKLLWFCPCGPFDVKSMLFLDGTVVDVESFENRAYVAAGEKGLYIVDCTHESKLEVIANYDTVGFLSSLYYRDGIVFAGDRYLGFYIFDVRGDVIKKLSFTPVEGGVRDIFIDGETLYISRGVAGVSIFDVSDLKKPKKIKDIDTPGIANHIFISNDYLYVADKYSVEVIEAK